MDMLSSLISPAYIQSLPWQISGPGIIIIFLFLLRGFFSLFKLRFIKAIISVIWAVCIAIILTQGGSMIARLIGVSK